MRDRYGKISAGTPVWAIPLSNGIGPASPTKMGQVSIKIFSASQNVPSGARDMKSLEVL